MSCQLIEPFEPGLLKVRKRSDPLCLWIFSGIQKTVYGLCKLAIEGSDGCKRYLDEAMLAGPLHQLSDAICVIEIHDHIKTSCACYTDNLTKLGKSTKYMIRFDDDSGDSGTH